MVGWTEGKTRQGRGGGGERKEDGRGEVGSGECRVQRE